jgi:hypothetical protein
MNGLVTLINGLRNACSVVWGAQVLRETQVFIRHSYSVWVDGKGIVESSFVIHMSPDEAEQHARQILEAVKQVKEADLVQT